MNNICYSADEEQFEDDIDSVIDTILFNSDSIEEARESLVFIGESVRPKINPQWIMEYIQERAQECVYEQCGEYADNFEATTDYDLALLTHIKEWVNKLNINCYTVENVKSESIMNYVTEQELQDFFKD